MEIKNITIISEFDKLPLQAVVYAPDGEKKGVLQILHGMCEYKERYAEFMRYFAEKGFVVFCHDQRGHGDSVLDEADRGYFYDLTSQAIVLDAAQVTRFLKNEYPNLPITLFGHSMGSMVARCYLQNHDDLIDKAIICGAPCKNPLAGAAIALEKTIRLFCGARHKSKLLAYLSTGRGSEQFKRAGKGSWLSRNEENVREFHSNPKGNYKFCCNGFENLFRLMKRSFSKKDYEVKNPTLPIHFVSGSDDAVLGSEKNFDEVCGFLREVGYKRVTGKLYEGLRHEIFYDIGKEEVLTDLLDFLCN